MTTSREEIQALRRRAENYLKKASERIIWDRPGQDAAQLVHELQVYQIELELQCEEMQRAQQELENSRNRYAELYESIPVGYFTFDRQGTIEDVNPVGCALLNQSLSDLQAKRFQLFMPNSERRPFTDFCKRILDTQAPDSCEVRLSPGGPDQQGAGEKEETTVLIEGHPVKSGHGAGERLRAAVIDISPRKRAERRLEQQERELRASRHALQEANAKVLNAQDEERRIIARELHDDCCQQLALLVITANSIERLTPEPLARRVHAMAVQLKQVLDTVRHIAYGLHPAMWETTGIVEAARSYIQDFISVTEVPVDLHVTDIPQNLPRSIATCLFRTLQEALHNVVKYSEASAVTVRLEKTADTVVLTVSDNGRGFDAQRPAASPRGLGLISLRERVHLLNGRLDIQSQPGQGTTVRSSLPLLTHFL